MKSVTITWTDGTQESYRCETAIVDSGVLYLRPYRHDVDQPVRAIPLHNVKIWTVDER